MIATRNISRFAYDQYLPINYIFGIIKVKFHTSLMRGLHEVTALQLTSVVYAKAVEFEIAI